MERTFPRLFASWRGRSQVSIACAAAGIAGNRPGISGAIFVQSQAQLIRFRKLCSRDSIRKRKHVAIIRACRVSNRTLVVSDLAITVVIGLRHLLEIVSGEIRRQCKRRVQVAISLIVVCSLQVREEVCSLGGGTRRSASSKEEISCGKSNASNENTAHNQRYRQK